MRKIKPCVECPIDNIFIHLSEMANNVWKYLQFTPNTLTTLSLVFGLLSVYFLWKGYIKSCILMYIISYYFDVNDGDYAREYDMVSNFGDLYDHIKDVIIFLLLIGIIIYRNYNRHSGRKLMYVGIFLSVVLLITLTHLGCQERIYNKDEYVLTNFSFLCRDKRHIKYTRWGGMGTFIFVFLFVVYYLETTKK